MDELLWQAFGALIGSVIVLPIAIWSSGRFARHYSEPAVAKRGGIAYMYILIFLVVLPVINLMDVIDPRRFQAVANIAIAGMLGLMLGLLLSVLDRLRFIARLPVIGRSLNAYFLALARARLENVQKQVRRYEEIDAALVRA